MALLFAARLGAEVGSIALARQSGAPGRSVWDGVYTDAQAARGKRGYDISCASCHGEDLGGREGRPLVGAQFWQSWGEDSLNSLFAFIRTTMPHGQPGSLDGEDYLDIVTYILKKNDYPSGREELTADRVGKIRVIRKDGPGPVPNFALVTVVGCLSEPSRGLWVLTNGSEPVRTRNPEVSADEERQRSGATPPGPNTFELMGASQAGKAYSGHKMEVKGLLIRGAPDRLNVTSMQTLAERCAP